MYIVASEIEDIATVYTVHCLLNLRKLNQLQTLSLVKLKWYCILCNLKTQNPIQL